MALSEAKCGTTTVVYDKRCTWSCTCDPKGCDWSVTCPGPKKGDDTVTTGTGLIKPEGSRDRSRDWLKVSGDVVACANALEKRWKRRVTVPARMKKQKFRGRTVRGTPEEMADALGLTLAPTRGR
jgi:hypothetical protein